MIIDGEAYKFQLGEKDFHCALDITSHFIGGKWKAVVLWYLRKEKKRFKELKELIPDITDKMLSLQLKSLEQDGLIQRQVFAEIPPRVEYEFTETGKSIIPVLEAMAKWGHDKVNAEGTRIRV